MRVITSLPLNIIARLALWGSKAAGNVLLFPGDDPGSLGDEAIMRGTIGQLRLRGANRIGIVRRRTRGIPISYLGPDVKEEPIWNGAFSFINVLRRYGVLVILGADVMDGYYSERQSCELITYANAAATWGRGAAILGCSFNNTPSASVCRSIGALHSEVVFSIRDPRSLERFVAATGRSAKLAMDPAFLMEPSGPTPASGPCLDWIKNCKASGGRVVGICVNPIPFLNRREGGRERFLSSVAGLVKAMTNEYCLLFIPHDYRQGVGDTEMLKALWEKLPELAREKCRMMNERLSAPEAKEICGSLHAVISGRLHLCIAAIGMAVPAFGFSYQNKFQGLFELIHGDRRPMLEAAQCLDEAKLRSAVFDFLASRDKLQHQVAERLPGVVAMAADNFQFQL